MTPLLSILSLVYLEVNAIIVPPNFYPSELPILTDEFESDRYCETIFPSCRTIASCYADYADSDFRGGTFSCCDTRDRAIVRAALERTSIGVFKMSCDEEHFTLLYSGDSVVYFKRQILREHKLRCVPYPRLMPAIRAALVWLKRGIIDHPGEFGHGPEDVRENRAPSSMWSTLVCRDISAYNLAALGSSSM